MVFSTIGDRGFEPWISWSLIHLRCQLNYTQFKFSVWFFVTLIKQLIYKLLFITNSISSNQIHNIDLLKTIQIHI